MERTPLTPEQLKEIQAMLEVVSQPRASLVTRSRGGGEGVPDEVSLSVEYTIPLSEQDAKLIAHARESAPRLVEVLRRMLLQRRTEQQRYADRRASGSL